jgi:hypothetical protein
MQGFSPSSLSLQLQSLSLVIVKVKIYLLYCRLYLPPIGKLNLIPSKLMPKEGAHFCSNYRVLIFFALYRLKIQAFVGSLQKLKKKKKILKLINGFPSFIYLVCSC